MIAIVDYGVGNLFSLCGSFAEIGVEAVATNDKNIITKADKVVLPGVGAFSDAAAKLRGTGLDKTLCEMAGTTPLLGICLGMQMLFERSFEYGEHRGLGLIPGDIVAMRDVIAPTLKVPQIGWNALKFNHENGISPLYSRIKEGDYVYFVHSFYAKTDSKYVSALCEYGADLTASAENGTVFGTQFHPEKSGKTGLNILRAFAEM